MNSLANAPAKTALASTKLVLRKTLRQRRNALSAAQQTHGAQALAEQMKTLPLFQQSQRIALYLANDGEIDPSQILEWSVAHRKQCYAPIISCESAHAADKAIPSGTNKDKTHGKVLRFAEITPHSRFQKNHLGIAEPVETELIDATELDLVLLPLVGFDCHGNRLGMGGGFYDTTFAFKKGNQQHRPQLIGLAHECQRLDKIETQHWDIPLCAVVTDQHIYQCATHTA